MVALLGYMVVMLLTPHYSASENEQEILRLKGQ